MINKVKFIIAAMMLLVMASFAFSFEVTKVQKESFPELRLIGKYYTEGDFGKRWEEWHENKWFDELEKLGPSDAVEKGPLGLMTLNADDHSGFRYWIGMLFPADTDVPDGFEYLYLPASSVGVAWIYGSDRTGDIYGGDPHTAAYRKLSEQGWGRLNENAGGADMLVFFERYNPERFVEDEHENVTLDYGFYIID